MMIRALTMLQKRVCNGLKRFKGLKMLTITLHQKTDNDGWQTIKSLPIDSAQWCKIDRSWISTLIESGSMVITIGHTMYSIDKN
jgi:hypothetical protein